MGAAVLLLSFWKKRRRLRTSPSSRARSTAAGGAAQGVVDAARAGDIIAVDGETGEAYLRPMPEHRRLLRSARALRAKRVAQFAAVRDLPAVTRDGVPIKLMMNAGLLLDMPHLEESGADGIGLFRTELQFMIGETMPRLADQIVLLQASARSGGR